jgi:predicted RNase H-like HicB family nuclease
MEYTIRIKENKDGWLSGQCEQLPQAISQGKDLDDLMENMKDAIETVLAYQQEEYRKKYDSGFIVKPLSIRHEAKRTSKTSERQQVYA